MFPTRQKSRRNRLQHSYIYVPCILLPNIASYEIHVATTWFDLADSLQKHSNHWSCDRCRNILEHLLHLFSENISILQGNLHLHRNLRVAGDVTHEVVKLGNGQ